MSTLSLDEFARVQMLSCLATDAVAARVMAKNAYPGAGDLIGVRLNLNIFKSTCISVHTLHRATNKTGYKANKGFFRGEVVGYAPAVILKDAYFNVDQTAREEIASGSGSKRPMASVDGTYARDARQGETQGIEMRFNPKKTHLFVDNDNRAIHYAEEVTVIGHRVFARGRVIYYDEHTAPTKAGDAPSVAHFAVPGL